jgi:hypothetical protein
MQDSEEPQKSPACWETVDTFRVAFIPSRRDDAFHVLQDNPRHVRLSTLRLTPQDSMDCLRFRNMAVLDARSQQRSCAWTSWRIRVAPLLMVMFILDGIRLKAQRTKSYPES